MQGKSRCQAWLRLTPCAGAAADHDISRTAWAVSRPACPWSSRKGRPPSWRLSRTPPQFRTSKLATVWKSPITVS